MACAEFPECSVRTAAAAATRQAPASANHIRAMMARCMLHQAKPASRCVHTRAVLIAQPASAACVRSGVLTRQAVCALTLAVCGQLQLLRQPLHMQLQPLRLWPSTGERWPLRSGASAQSKAAHFACPLRARCCRASPRMTCARKAQCSAGCYSCDNAGAGSCDPGQCYETGYVQSASGTCDAVRLRAPHTRTTHGQRWLALLAHLAIAHTLCAIAC